jgi:SAM-dependent methyltransferase
MAIKHFLLKAADVTGLSAKLSRARLDAFLKTQASSARTLDIGGGSKPYRKYFPNSVSVDILAREGVDVVGDAHDLHMFKDAEFDIILSTEVLEHLHTPEKALSEMHRTLKSGGTLILTTRFIFPLHNVPGDFFRFTPYGLHHLLRNFSKIDISEEASTIETVAVLLERMAFQTDTLGMKSLSFVWLILSKVTRLFKWLITAEYGDVTRETKVKSVMSSGYYVIAVK